MAAVLLLVCKFNILYVESYNKLAISNFYPLFHILPNNSECGRRRHPSFHKPAGHSSTSTFSTPNCFIGILISRHFAILHFTVHCARIIFRQIIVPSAMEAMFNLAVKKFLKLHLPTFALRHKVLLLLALQLFAKSIVLSVWSTRFAFSSKLQAHIHQIQRQCLILPCKHLVVCNRCSLRLIVCPICRGYIDERIESVFLP